MSDLTFRRNNHYVPEFLLRRFSVASRQGFLWQYRLLVEDVRVPEWELRPASVLARLSDLYTVAGPTKESDEIERWLAEEFENPATEAVVAATNGQRLDKTQWRQLVRFYGAQFVRTPAYYILHKDQWALQMEHILRETQERLLLEIPKCRDIEGEQHVVERDDGFPLRYTIRRLEGSQRTLHIEHVTGRKHWMWQMKHALRPNGLIAQLEQYKWSILIAPAGSRWFLTDNPAICLRMKSDGTKTIDGGWGMPNSRLMLPLGPAHMLYCEVGNKALERYVRVSAPMASNLRRDMCRAALRSFYCSVQDDDLALYRPRRVDRSRFQDEADQWAEFGREQSQAERFE